MKRLKNCLSNRRNRTIAYDSIANATYSDTPDITLPAWSDF